MSEVRPATIEDIDGIHRVSAFLGYQASSEAETRSRLEALLNSNEDRVWVFADDGRIQGWLHLFVARRLASPSFAEIGGLVVDPEVRRGGVGGRLVTQAVRWARQKRLPLRVRCNAQREAANRFYRSLAFDTLKTQNVHQRQSD